MSPFSESLEYYDARIRQAGKISPYFGSTGKENVSLFKKQSNHDLPLKRQSNHPFHDLPSKKQQNYKVPNSKSKKQLNKSVHIQMPFDLTPTNRKFNSAKNPCKNHFYLFLFLIIIFCLLIVSSIYFLHLSHFVDSSMKILFKFFKLKFNQERQFTPLDPYSPKAGRGLSVNENQSEYSNLINTLMKRSNFTLEHLMENCVENITTAEQFGHCTVDWNRVRDSIVPKPVHQITLLHETDDTSMLSLDFSDKSQILVHKQRIANDSSIYTLQFDLLTSNSLDSSELWTDEIFFHGTNMTMLIDTEQYCTANLVQLVLECFH